MMGDDRMSERFHPLPKPLRRILFYVAMLVYIILGVMGYIGVAYPAEGFTRTEFFFVRLAGWTLLFSSAICWLSYPLHRWRWELRMIWLVGISIGIYLLVLLSVDVFYTRGLLPLSLTIVMIGAYVRGVVAIGFESSTRKAKVTKARHLIWWRRS